MTISNNPFSGYQEGGDGQCNDINECSINGGTCSNGCQNFNGGFSCGCQNGSFKVGNRLADSNQPRSVDSLTKS